MKLVPWFLDVNKKIRAICFSPDANWLVVIAHDGSIHIVPALPLVDTTASFDHRWSISDVTSFPYPYLGSTVTPCPKQGCPTSIVWWQSAQEYHQTVIVGNDLGEIRFFSLTSEKQVGITYVKEAILSLHICEDNTLETVFLLSEKSMIAQLLPSDATKLIKEAAEKKDTVGFTKPQLMLEGVKNAMEEEDKKKMHADA
uniref:Uncharacterized protein n=1 Tax=Timema cristinae TaxID=61476 RepID=A0A7R9H8L1_TIMCR|nr:unnamed protein product [Timema cristinae]